MLFQQKYRFLLCSILFLLLSTKYTNAQDFSLKSEYEKVAKELHLFFVDLFLGNQVDQKNLDIFQQDHLCLENIVSNLNTYLDENKKYSPIIDSISNDFFSQYDLQQKNLYSKAMLDLIDKKDDFLKKMISQNRLILDSNSTYHLATKNDLFLDQIRSFLDIKEVEDQTSRMVKFLELERLIKNFNDHFKKDTFLNDQKLIINYMMLIDTIYSFNKNKINYYVSQILLDFYDKNLASHVKDSMKEISTYVDENFEDLSDVQRAELTRFNAWLENDFFDFFMNKIKKNEITFKLREKVSEFASNYLKSNLDIQALQIKANQILILKFLYLAYFHYSTKSEVSIDYHIKHSTNNHQYVEVSDDTMKVLRLYNDRKFCLSSNDQDDCRLDVLAKNMLHIEEIKILCNIAKYEYCGVLGALSYKGKDLDLSFSYFKEACDIAKNQRSCTNLGVLKANEQFKGQNIDEAKTILSDMCKTDAYACVELALIKYNQGDLDGSKSLFEKACSFNHGRGCRNLGVLKEEEGKIEESKGLFQKACDLEDMEACVLLKKLQLIDLIKIRGGSFMMGSEDGSSDERPMHRVEVKDFYMSKTEVTVGQYRKCVEAGVCSKPNICNWTDEIGNKENYPINCVDWRQARVFAKWVGGDLPSEAQWEYASRSEGRDIKYPWGNNNPTCEIANFNIDCHRGTTAVCSKTGGNTAQGLCDMAGNVWEWVLDEWHGSYENAPSNDIGWCSDRGCDSNTSASRVNRGSSWNFSVSALRSAFRYTYSPDYRLDYLGFRVAVP